MGDRLGRRLGHLAACVAITSAVAACGGSSSASDDRETWQLSPPGTPIGDGFDVVDGTSLIADPIPLGVTLVRNGVPIVDEGWIATSVVDDAEPLAVLDDYLVQADAAGLTDQQQGACGMDAEVAICVAYARTEDPTDLRSVNITVLRGSRGDVYSNHVVVAYSTNEWQWERGQATSGAGESADPPATIEWQPLPQVGEPIGRAEELRSDVLVQEGSGLAGPTHLHLGDSTGGVVALLEVTGDPQEVLQRYLEALDESFGTPGERRVLDLDGGGTLTQQAASEAGGDQVGFTMVERPGRPTWLVIEGTHD